jgi:hypothetical protein
MLHGDFSGMFNLPIGTAECSREPGGRHRTGDTHLALAADLSAAD